MTFDELAASMDRRLGQAVQVHRPEAGDPWMWVDLERLREVLTACRDEAEWSFDMLSNLTAVDWLIRDEKWAKKLAIEPHLELVYHLFSLRHRHRLTIKVRLERWQNGEPSRLPIAPSVSDLWGVANWHEREIFDLMGIRFDGHPDLRRILCADDWVGHPLRKDYEFPLEYQGVRCRMGAGEGQPS